MIYTACRVGALDALPLPPDFGGDPDFSNTVVGDDQLGGAGMAEAEQVEPFSIANDS